jgi:hypothetical protein
MVAKKKYRLRRLKTDFRVEALRRRDEVREVVAWMNRTQGAGWKKRMQYLDGYMDEDLPSLWVSGRRVPTLESVQRLREYAQRFGYGKISSDEYHTRPLDNASVNTNLATAVEALSELASPTPDIAEKIHAPPSPIAAG